MTIIEREKWRCEDCGAEDYYYELMSTNDFWGDLKIPLITVHQKAPKVRFEEHRI